jgi:predicted metal-dependent hydrolase
MRDALPHLGDDRLREAVKGFIAQEATHAKAHGDVLDHMRARGLDPDAFLADYARVYDWLAGPQPPVPMPEAWWLNWRLAHTAAAEQLTCVAGHWVLGADALDAAGADLVMLSFMRWHGAEEVEHRAVAFDVFTHLVGPHEYPLRAAAMVALLPVLGGLALYGTQYLLARDPDLAGLDLTWQALAEAAARGHIPGPAWLAAVLGYFDPAFHPARSGSDEAARAFFAAMAEACPAGA